MKGSSENPNQVFRHKGFGLHEQPRFVLGKCRELQEWGWEAQGQLKSYTLGPWLQNVLTSRHAQPTCQPTQPPVYVCCVAASAMEGVVLGCQVGPSNCLGPSLWLPSPGTGAGGGLGYVRWGKRQFPIGLSSAPKWCKGQMPKPPPNRIQTNGWFWVSP